MCIEGNMIDLQLDTASDVSLLPESLYMMYLSHVPLQPANIVLRTYDNQKVELVGKCFVTVRYEDQGACRLPLLITKGTDKDALFGLQWLENIKLDWPKVCSVPASLSAVREKHSDVFSEGLIDLTGAKANIYVDSRSVPCAMKRKVEEEVDRLVESKVIEPVLFSEWATSILPVFKADGNIRICGDYKQTVNRVSHLEQYPIPALDELCEKSTGGNSNAQMENIVSEYERNITEIIAEQDHEKKAHQEDIAELMRERDQAYVDTQSVESAFADLHRRYEKTKPVIESFKKNEDTLKGEVKPAGGTVSDPQEIR